MVSAIDWYRVVAGRAVEPFVFDSNFESWRWRIEATWVNDKAREEEVSEKVEEKGEEGKEEEIIELELIAEEK